MGIVLTVTTVAPIVAIVQDTFKIHAGTIDAHLTGQVVRLYRSSTTSTSSPAGMAKTNLWTPLLNTVLLAVGTCVVSILFGGAVCLPHHPHQPGMAKIPELHLYFPLHHAPVDAGRGVAEPV